MKTLWILIFLFPLFCGCGGKAERNGHWKELYDNGSPKREGSYKNDQKDGLWTVWYPDGEKASEMIFSNGSLNTSRK